jgi:hypothetical protein
LYFDWLCAMALKQVGHRQLARGLLWRDVLAS